VARHRSRGATHVYSGEQTPLSLSSPAILSRPPTRVTRITSVKKLLLLLISIVLANHCNGDLLYSNNFNSSSSLDSFTIGQVGSGSVGLNNGQLTINPGGGYLNRAYAALILSAIPSLNAVLSSNSVMIVIAFNVSNSDGGPNQNNLFQFGIYSSPDPANSTSYGYKLGAGGYVGDQMYFTRSASSQSPFGPVSETFILVYNGLSTLPQVGAVKIAFEPKTGQWRLYFEQHNSAVDPLSITNLVGSGVNSGFASNALPYITFESENYGSVFIDNLSISSAPEPNLTISASDNTQLQIIVQSGYPLPGPRAVVLQSTTNFVNWASISTNLYSGNSVTNIVQAANKMNFYRAMFP